MGDVEIEGADNITWFRASAIAERGVLFEDGVVQAAQCAPSRNSTITGRYPHQLGYYGNGDRDFLQAKLATGRYYMARQLPATGMHLARIQSGAEPVMALEQSWVRVSHRMVSTSAKLKPSDGASRFRISSYS